MASSVEPSEGSLAAGETDTINITAWNRAIGSKGGYIHIIKTLKDAEKYSTEYVKSLIFKFKISVDGYTPETVALEPKLVDNTWVWEYTSERYSWKADPKDPSYDPDYAPGYTIEEVDLPEGTEFESATGPEGSTVSGRTITGKLKASSTQDVKITTDNSFINKLTTEYSDELIIEKEVTHESLLGKEFQMDVTIKGTCDFSYTDLSGNVVNETITNTEKTVTIKVIGGQNQPQLKLNGMEM